MAGAASLLLLLTACGDQGEPAAPQDPTAAPDESVEEVPSEEHPEEDGGDGEAATGGTNEFTGERCVVADGDLGFVGDGAPVTLTEVRVSVDDDVLELTYVFDGLPERAPQPFFHYLPGTDRDEGRVSLNFIPVGGSYESWNASHRGPTMEPILSAGSSDWIDGVDVTVEGLALVVTMQRDELPGFTVPFEWAASSLVNVQEGDTQVQYYVGDCPYFGWEGRQASVDDYDFPLPLYTD